MAAAPVAAAGPVPRVALVVGPVGGTTGYYKGLANEAAAAARRAGAEVVTVYSPNATWPAVQEALTGASVVVYLGHGNGWPSRYRDELYPATQNGFGLNPVAGADDRNHQYFGEASVETLELAPNAVVVLSHLCYASGNTEPGLPEGTQDEAIQRVDNFAAGFLRAGARAVIAEAHMGPAYYVKALLAGRGNVERIWGASPTHNGVAPIAVSSSRSTGYTVRLDPERSSGGYVRSLVSRGGLTTEEVRGGAMGRLGATPALPPADPSLVSAGVRFGVPTFRNLPVATAATRLTFPFAAGSTRDVPKGAQLSVRWDPLVLDAPLAVPPAAASPDAPSAPDATTDPSAEPGAAAPPAATSEPEAASTPEAEPAAPEVQLVVPEQLGAVVEPLPAANTKKGLRVDLAFPRAPGLYRLVPTLHTPEGVAYDAGTQALLTPVLVRVRSPLAVAYGAPSSLTVEANAHAALPLRVVNAGSMRWDLEVTAPQTRVAGEPQSASRTTTLRPNLVATWVSTAGLPVPAAQAIRLEDAVSAPGGSTAIDLALTAPAAPGAYLLLLDVVAASGGPLSSLGSDPAIVRVTVGEPAAPEPPKAGPRRPGG